MFGELGPLIDHHCHGLVLDDLDRPAFEALLNEAARPAAAGTTFFDSLLGLAVRRWCAPVLDLPIHASPEDYLERRRELGPDASRQLLVASGIEEFFVDTGPPDPRLCSAAEVADLAGGTAHEVLRLETLAEDLLGSGVSPVGLPDRIEQELSETTAVALKSVAAYRVGLDLPVVRPSRAAVERGFDELVGPSGHRYRIAHPVVHAWLAWTAIEVGLPLQIHVGYGDADLDLRRADPLRLTAFLRVTEERGVPVLLLHNYPYQRQAAYLAQVFQHVSMDVGLAVHNSGALSRAVIAEALELVPFAKLLFSTDAYGLAELYYLGALLFRRGLSGVLTDLVDADEMTNDDAERILTLIARENSRRVYRV
ncbi:MAG TPA: amidohydrolase family protein [Microlunatus sp.]